MKKENAPAGMEEVVIDAENAIAGRLASYTAKQLLLGKKIKIVNSEKAVIIGNERDILNKYLILRRKGGSAMKGPFFPSGPDRLLKRIIRGMLPQKKGRGRDALKRVRCYIRIPEELKNFRMVKSSRSTAPIKSISLEKLSGGLKYRG
ncbi:50S ribosomal protein L13 [Candidatus Pacearchaeota archaeon]|nr:50S ribosomal protein L13 [Candidatus Pacearchaeota archaeon]